MTSNSIIHNPLSSDEKLYLVIGHISGEGINTYIISAKNEDQAEEAFHLITQPFADEGEDIYIDSCQLLSEYSVKPSKTS